MGLLRRLLTREVLLVASLVLGASMFGLSLRHQTVDDFLPSALVEVGAAFLLLVPLLFLERRLETQVGEVRRQVEDTRADLLQTERRLDALTPSEAVSEAVAKRLAESRQDDEALFDEVARTPSADVVRRALVRGSELEVVSRRMPRVPLFDTTYLVRFVPGVTIEAAASLDDAEMKPWLRVDLEDEDGETAHSIEWVDGMSAVDLGETVARWLIERGRYPGDAAFQPGRMFEDLRSLLRRSHAAITGSRGVTADLAPVVQLCGSDIGGDYWWITDVGVQQDNLMYMYTVAKDRFEEIDWDRHVTSKSGVDGIAFRQAFETAQALHKRGLL